MTKVYLPAPRKYRNQPQVVDGLRFASKREAARYQELKLLEKSGKISGLKLQQDIELLPPQKGERKAVWRADFVYTETGTKEEVWEDTKGKRTPLYILKRKLVLFRHGKRILET